MNASIKFYDFCKVASLTLDRECLSIQRQQKHTVHRIGTHNERHLEVIANHLELSAEHHDSY